MKCPGFEKLIDLVDGRLVQSEAERVSEHLATGCSQCHAEKDWYENVKRTAFEDDTQAPPPWVLKRAIRIFENAKSRTLARRIRQAVATLVFDSLARPIPAGVRSTETSTRQLLYRAGDFSVDLQVAPSERSRVDLIGQVLREGEVAFDSVANLSVELHDSGKSTRRAMTNEMGEFILDGISAGTFDLMIQLPEGSITIPDLPVALP